MFKRCSKPFLMAWALATVVNVASAQHAPGPPPGSHGSGPGGGPGASGDGLPPSNVGSNAPSSSQAKSSSASNPSGSSQFGPPGRWWDDSKARQAVGLRTAQQKKMDSIFDANKSAIVSSYQELMTQQSKLDSLNRQANVDSKVLFAQIDLVNSARAKLQKATSEMLLEVRGQMDASQIDKLQNLK